VPEAGPRQDSTAARIVRGIPPERLDEAASLLFDAFDQKIRNELKPHSPEQARRIIARSLTPELGWLALAADGAVLGVTGVGMRGHHFSLIGFRLLAEEFGVPGALRRWPFTVLESLTTRPPKEHWRIEVLAVAESTRGTGIGTELLKAVIESAREAGMRSVGLEVVDVNDGALRLYERLGFEPVRTVRTGRLTSGGGYRGIHFMRLEL
jgi:ribosomal protein S18 acetylase RimI-like enzyme